MGSSETFEAVSCGISIDHSVNTQDGVEAVDAGGHVTLGFTTVSGAKLTVGMNRETFNRFLLEHLHLAEADLDQAPPVIVGRSGGASG